MEDKVKDVYNLPRTAKQELRRRPHRPERFKEITELPDAVREVLPEKAQEVYREAYNRASEPSAVIPHAAVEHSPDALAHKAAWQAVKKLYYRRGERWVLKRPSRPQNRLLS
jgi:cation transport regulator